MTQATVACWSRSVLASLTVLARDLTSAAVCLAFVAKVLQCLQKLSL